MLSALQRLSPEACDDSCPALVVGRRQHSGPLCPRVRSTVSRVLVHEDVLPAWHRSTLTSPVLIFLWQLQQSVYEGLFGCAVYIDVIVVVPLGTETYRVVVHDICKSAIESSRLQSGRDSCLVNIASRGRL